jgi:hypothetical protein
MKKLIFTGIAAALLFQYGHTQVSRDSLLKMTDYDLRTYYSNKSKQQKIVGWLLVGGGITLSIIGANKMAQDIFSKSSGGETLFLLGSFSAIASIPVFLSAAKNKGRAEILLRHQNIPLSHGFSRHISVGLAIPLTR